MNNFWIFVGFLYSVVIVALILAWMGYYLCDMFNLRKHRLAFVVFGTLFVFYAGAKHTNIQVVDLPAWLNVAVAYVEEQPTKATFTFSSLRQIPADTPIDFAVAIGGGESTNWISRPSTVYGLSPVDVSTADLTPSHITNYLVRITSDYIPEDSYIHDFTAIASKTNLAVAIDFNCSTNLIGAPGIVQHRDLEIRDGIKYGELPWQTDYSFSAMKDNHITILGNFVSRGTDREFRVVVSNEILNVWRFSR